MAPLELGSAKWSTTMLHNWYHVNCWTHLTCWNDVGDVEAALILEPVLWDQGEISKERTFKFCSRSFWYLYWQVDICACVCFCTTVFLLLITLSQFYFNPTFATGILDIYLCFDFWDRTVFLCFLPMMLLEAGSNACKSVIVLQNTRSNKRRQPLATFGTRTQHTHQHLQRLQLQQQKNKNVKMKFAWFKKKDYCMHAIN